MEYKICERDIRKWGGELERIRTRIGHRFARPEIRERALVYLRVLVSMIPRKNGWQVAEYAGDATPKNIQHFLGRSQWDADQLRDDLQQYVTDHLGQEDGVLIVDETGFLKKGTKSAGVGRQYSGTAGRIENCQIGVFLAYRSTKGHALIDRELYIPKAWCDNRQRCDEANIPKTLQFATKPAIARSMIQRAVAASIPARWVTADEVYGSDSAFRETLENRGFNYVLAISCQQRLFLNEMYGRVDEHVQELKSSSWKKLSCGAGTKGERVYDWAFVPYGAITKTGMQRGLLVRRSLTDHTDLAYYFTLALDGTGIQRLVNVAGCRWAIEECFEQAKQIAGLDEYEVRSWHAWYRHITLSMFSHSMLSVLRSRVNNKARKKKTKPSELASLKFGNY
jgi:SRSO17 transposase